MNFPVINGRIVASPPGENRVAWHRKNADGTRCPTCRPVIVATRHVSLERRAHFLDEMEARALLSPSNQLPAIPLPAAAGPGFVPGPATQSEANKSPSP